MTLSNGLIGLKNDTPPFVMIPHRLAKFDHQNIIKELVENAFVCCQDSIMVHPLIRKINCDLGTETKFPSRYVDIFRD